MQPTIIVRASRPRRPATDLRPTNYGQWNYEPGPSHESEELPATRISFEAADSGRLIVDESDIDFVHDDDDGIVVKGRPQKGSTAPKSLAMKDRKVGLDKKPLGEVRLIKENQGRAFNDGKDPKWYKCEYHWRLRRQFIDEDEASQDPYTFQPTSGPGELDVTSRCTDQKHWNVDDAGSIRNPRGVWVLPDDYKYKESEFFERQPPEWRLEDGTVVLDLYGHPVRKFRNIPSTLSSNLGGERIVGLRHLNGMTVHDLRARMPKYVGTEKDGYFPLQVPGAFTNHAIEYRRRFGLKPQRSGAPPGGKSGKSEDKQAGKRSATSEPDNDEEEKDLQRPRRKKQKQGVKGPSNEGSGTVVEEGTRKNPPRGSRAQADQPSKTGVHPEADIRFPEPPPHPSMVADSPNREPDQSQSQEQSSSPTNHDGSHPGGMDIDPAVLEDPNSITGLGDQGPSGQSGFNVLDKPLEMNEGESEQLSEDGSSQLDDHPRSEYGPPPDPDAPGPGPYHFE